MRYKNTAWAAAVVMALGAGVVLGQNTFNDVPDSDPRTEDIDYAAAQGWFQGYPDGSFRPDQQISEGQLAKVIRRARPGLTRGDAAVFLRGGIDRLQTVLTAAATAAVRTGEPGGEVPAQPGSGGPVDPNPPTVIEPTTTTTAPATTTTAAVQTGEPGGEVPAEPGSGGPVDPNPPVAIEPTTTTTAAPTTTTTAAAPANTYYYNGRPAPAGVEAGRTVMRYGYEHGWTDANGRSGSLFWFESYIRDYDVEVLEDRVLSSWAQSAESNVKFSLDGPDDAPGFPRSTTLGAGWTGVHFIRHRSDSLPPGHPTMPTDNTRMPRLHVAFAPYEIQRVRPHQGSLWNGIPYGDAAIRSHAMEEVSAMPERAKEGAANNGYSAPASQDPQQS